MPRRSKKYHFLYKTTCIITGNYYFGVHSTNDLDDGYLGSGVRLRYSIRKHGEENHRCEILEFVESRDELFAREKEIVNLNEVAKKQCMNLVKGGHGGGFKDDEHKRKFHAAGGRKVRQNFNKLHVRRLKTDEEYRQRVSESCRKSAHINGFLGKDHSEETKEKMRKSAVGKRKGSLNGAYGTCWIMKGEENRRVLKCDIDTWLSQGWTKGRRIKK